MRATSKGSSHHFLQETRSQQLHRLEAIRRRRELLERESKKPVQMRFGIGGRPPSCSPSPRVRSPVVVGTDSICKRPRDGTRHPSLVTRRPVSCDPPKVVRAPFARSSSAPPVRLAKRLVARSAANRPRAVPPFTTSSSLQRGEENPLTRGMLKRQRSLTVSASRSASLVSNLRKRTPLANARNKEKMPTKNMSMTAFGSSPSLTPPLNSMFQEDRDTRRERSPSPFFTTGHNVLTTVETHNMPLLPEGPLAVEPISLHHLKPFPLPGSRSISNAGSKEGNTPVFNSSAFAGVSGEIVETSSTFFSSGFPSPRTPKRRASLAITLSPATSQSMAIKRELAGDLSTDTCGQQVVVKEEIHSDTCGCLIPDSVAAGEPPVSNPSTTDNEFNGAGVDNIEQCRLLPLTEGIDKGRRTEDTMANTSFQGGPDEAVEIAPLSLELKVPVDYRPSAMTAHTFDCSPTTSEFEGFDSENDANRQLTFNTEETLDCASRLELTATAYEPLHLNVAIDGGKSNNDNQRINCEDDLCTPRVNRCGWAADTLSHEIGTDALSVQPNECMDVPCTPVNQILYSSPLRRDVLSATETSSLEAKLDPVFIAGETVHGQKEASRRGSLVLVTGENPTSHTPVLQEPHTPPPTEWSKSFCSDSSRLPRPVTLASAVCSPVSPRWFTRSLAERVVNHDAGCNGGGWSPPVRKHLEQEPADDRRVVCDVVQHNFNVSCSMQEAVIPLKSSPSGSSSRSSTEKSTEEMLMELPTPDAPSGARQSLASHTSCCARSLSQCSGQTFGEPAKSFSIGQRVGSQPRRHNDDCAHLERHPVESAGSSDVKCFQGGKIGTCNASELTFMSAEPVVTCQNVTTNEEREGQLPSQLRQRSPSTDNLRADPDHDQEGCCADTSSQQSSQCSPLVIPGRPSAHLLARRRRRGAKKARHRHVHRSHKG